MMKRKEEKKYDKIKILIISLLIYSILSWFLQSYMYESGEIVSKGWFRVGLYDLVAVAFSGITYAIKDVIYLLAVGGTYGILSKAESYKRIVNKASNFVKTHAELVFVLTTFVVGLYTAITSNIITLFILVPFIMTIFLKSGHDKLTALGAGFGGLFIGYLGQIVGTYGNDFLYQYLGVSASSDVIVKLVLFLIAFVLFNVFGILHLKKNKNVSEEESDMFAVEEPKKIVRRSEQIMTWPTVVVSIMIIVITMLGYIPWIDGLGITFFDKVHSAVMSFAPGNIRIMETLIGSTITALGTWEDFLPVLFMMFVLIIVVVSTNRMSFADLCKNYGEGLKKVFGVAIIYGLAYSFLYMTSVYSWSTALVDFFINPKSYNIIFIMLALIAAMLAIITCADPLYSGYHYGQYLSAIFTVNMGVTAILWRVGSGLGLLVGPTSFLLLAALTYADVPYKNWLKYIWKFALTFFIATVLVLGVVTM